MFYVVDYKLVSNKIIDTSDGGSRYNDFQRS